MLLPRFVLRGVPSAYSCHKSVRNAQGLSLSWLCGGQCSLLTPGMFYRPCCCSCCTYALFGGVTVGLRRAGCAVPECVLGMQCYGLCTLLLSKVALFNSYAAVCGACCESWSPGRSTWVSALRMPYGSNYVCFSRHLCYDT